jgi:hypothetical protein
MPNYKDGSVFSQLPTDGNFDTLHLPGHLAPFSGIYKCNTCGFECVSTRGNTLPPTESCLNHAVTWKSQHGLVRWRLVAAAVHISKNA